MAAVWDWLITSRKRLRCEDTRETWSEQDVSPNLSILTLFLAVYSSLLLAVYRLKCIIWKYKRPLNLRQRSKRQTWAVLNCVFGPSSSTRVQQCRLLMSRVAGCFHPPQHHSEQRRRSFRWNQPPSLFPFWHQLWLCFKTSLKYR